MSRWSAPPDSWEGGAWQGMAKVGDFGYHIVHFTFPDL